jgi:hypothetical protein
MEAVADGSCGRAVPVQAASTRQPTCHMNPVNQYFKVRVGNLSLLLVILVELGVLGHVQ